MTNPINTFTAQSTADEVTAGIDLTGTRWVITGVNSGLGAETARVLSDHGAFIYGLARTEEKAIAAQEAHKIEGVPVACELSDLNSIHRAIAAIDGPLDGIIANAGVMALQTHQTVHGIERQFFVNHLGHFELVTKLLPQLSNRGRVVILSSGAHHMAAAEGIEFENLSGSIDYDPWRMYGQSKLANLLFAQQLAVHFEGSGRTANSVHPGVIQTNLGRHVPDAAAMYAQYTHIEKTVAQGAATQCMVATHPSLAKTSGRYFSDCKMKRPSAAARREDLRESLWKKSDEILEKLR